MAIAKRKKPQLQKMQKRPKIREKPRFFGKNAYPCAKIDVEFPKKRKEKSKKLIKKRQKTPEKTL